MKRRERNMEEESDDSKFIEYIIFLVLLCLICFFTHSYIINFIDWVISLLKQFI